MKNRNLCQALLRKSKKIELKLRTPALQQSKIKIYNSKISSNLDLPHSLVFVVLFESINFCVSDIKHIKTTESELNLECTLRTRGALFCISSQSPSHKFSILSAISKPCPPFKAVCEETRKVTAIIFSGIPYE